MILCSEKWILITFISTKPRKKSRLIIFWWCSFTLCDIYLSGFRNEWLCCCTEMSYWSYEGCVLCPDSETLNIQHHINDILTIRVGCLSTPHKSWVMLGYNCHDSSYFCYIKLYRCKYGNTEASVSRPGVVWQQWCHQQNNKGASPSKHSPATCIKSGFYKVVLSFSTNFQLI